MLTRTYNPVPIIFQMTFADCGAACLAMIVSYHGRKTRLAECREYFGTGRDGVSAWEIMEAGEKFGLEVGGYQVAVDDLAEVPLPAIAHWEGNHFVVLEECTATHIRVVDPAYGRVRYTIADFANHFSEIVLTFEPNETFTQQAKAQPPAWQTYLQTMLKTEGASSFLFKVIVASILLQLFNITLPLLTQWLIDDVIGLEMGNLMPLLGLGIFLITFTHLVTAYARARLLILLQARLDKQMMLDFFAHILSLPIYFFQQRTSGDLLNRLGSNMTIREVFTNNTLSTILDGFLVITYLLILIFWAPLFGLVVLLLGLIQIALLLATTAQVHILTQRALVGEVKSHSYLLEALNNIITLKAFGAEDRVHAHWSTLFNDYLDILIKKSFVMMAIDSILMTIRLFSPIFLLWIGAFFVLNDTMSLGTMLGLNALAISFLTPLSSLIQNGQQLQFIGAHLARVADVMEAEPEQKLHTAKPAPALTGRIEVKDVSFQYNQNGAVVLANISLTIEPGQKIAIVGHTGSGKSTLGALLLGLYLPTEGKLLFDNYELQTLNYQSVRRQFGVVLQEISLFNTSIRENIGMQDHHIALDKVTTAAKLAAIHDEIDAMPMGYETILGEDGTGLSGGQKQRLMLARALVNQPKILLLDEATSHLDTVTEHQIMKNLNALKLTRIVIAHRLSTIQDADQIIVLNKGQIVAIGTHYTLLDNDPYYTALVHGQTNSMVLQPDRDTL
ncbi:MAG TPA: peptidase domain-containing ABC transporter [Anaerolineae bacterium]|nr:peptidase domain-containing ABC transporter [Anaerolineae bacterium]